MALTKDFATTVRARAQCDPAFRRELLRGAIESFLEGDIGTGKIVLRDYINGTLGFEQLAALTEIPSKSLIRRFGPNGNPLDGNLFDILGHLQRAEGVRVHTTLTRRRVGVVPRAEGVLRWTSHPTTRPTRSAGSSRW